MPFKHLTAYWKDGKHPFSKQVKLGLAQSCNKFSESDLAKHHRRGSEVNLCDVMALVHPKPRNKEQGLVFAKLCNKTSFPKATKFSRFPVARVYGGFKKRDPNT